MEDFIKDEPTGFRGVEWGTKRSSIQDMGFKKIRNSAGCYERLNERLVIDYIDLDYIIWEFWHNKFYGVRISFPIENWDLMMGYCLLKFGNYHIKKDSGDMMKGNYQDTYIWRGQVTIINLCKTSHKEGIFFKKIRTNGDLLICSTEIFHQKEKEEKLDI